MGMRKFCIPYIPCQSLLLGTTVLNDNLCSCHRRFNKGICDKNVLTPAKLLESGAQVTSINQEEKNGA